MLNTIKLLIKLRLCGLKARVITPACPCEVDECVCDYANELSYSDYA